MRKGNRASSYENVASKGDDLDMTEIKYGELAREASKEVEGLDEPLRSIAYKTILDELIGDAKSVESDEKRQTTENRTESAAKRDPIDASTSVRAYRNACRSQ